MKPYYEEPNAVLYHGHALDVLKAMPSDSVDCVITSPPYWGLRTYKTEPIVWDDHTDCEHEWGNSILGDTREYGAGIDTWQKGAPSGKPHIKVSQGNFCLKCHAWKGELGLEPTIELYVSHLLQIFDEVKRVVKSTGTLWVNIGDSYAGSGKGIGSEPDPKWPTARCDENKQKTDWQAMGTPAKSLCLIPERFALGMLDKGWIVRNVVIWNKRNPMPESAKDRFTGAYEYLYFFTKGQRYWFEQQFESALYGEFTGFRSHQYENDNAKRGDTVAGGSRRPTGINMGRNKRDVWEINTQPSPIRGVHFATFPEKLCETPILAGCPSAICRQCGKAREKIYKKGFTEHSGETESRYPTETTAKRLALLRQASRERGSEYVNEIEVIGITDCGCNVGFEPGVVIDIFAGIGTTGVIAKRLGRQYIGIELSGKYCKLHMKRLQGVPLPMVMI